MSRGGAKFNSPVPAIGRLGISPFQWGSECVSLKLVISSEKEFRSIPTKRHLYAAHSPPPTHHIHLTHSIPFLTPTHAPHTPHSTHTPPRRCVTGLGTDDTSPAGTAFPQSLGMAAAFAPDLVHRVGPCGCNPPS